MRLIAAALAGLILTSSALAQRGVPPSPSAGPARGAQAPSLPLPEGTGSIAGRLLDRESKAPIPGIAIEIELHSGPFRIQFARRLHLRSVRTWHDT